MVGEYPSNGRFSISTDDDRVERVRAAIYKNLVLEAADVRDISQALIKF